MHGKWPWFERKFDFAFPAEKFPDIVERLRGTPVRVEEKVNALEAATVTQRDGDTWSIQENVGHLLTVEALWIGRVDDILGGAETMRPADLTNRATHEADHNSASISTLTSSFRAERQRLVARLEGLEPHSFAESAVHPRLGKPMRLVDLCLFAADHDDYHLARITELGRAFSG